MLEPQPEYTFAVEYPCERHCRIELDLTAVHLAYTQRQMRTRADAEHEKQHPGVLPPAKNRSPQPIPTLPARAELTGAPIYDGLTATFRAPSS